LPSAFHEKESDMPSLGGWEWVILALIALLLFGGSRLAGIGRNAGTAIREFKEETSTLRSAGPAEPAAPASPSHPASPAAEPGADNERS
jgi:sec-independent protein translocase protein TatA